MDKIEKKSVQLAARNQLRHLAQEHITYQTNVVDVEIGSLIRPAYSSRKQIENLLLVLEKSLKSYGFLGGIFVESESKHVIDGWHRVLLWKQLGNTTIPCHFVTCNPIQERKLHLSLNVASAAFDLGDFGQEYGGIDLIEYGFTEADLQAKGLLLKEKFPSLNNRNGQEAESSSSYCKLMTNLPTTTFEDLQTIKKEIQARSIANTIIYLVKNYYEKDSRN